MVQCKLCLNVINTKGNMIYYIKTNKEVVKEHKGLIMRPKEGMGERGI